MDLKPVAIYDVAAAPVTFDFVKFLAAARIFFAAQRGSTEFDVVILCDRFRNWSAREKSMSLSERQWRLHNLLLPILELAPDVRSIALTFNRSEVSQLKGDLIYPSGYDAWNPKIPYLDNVINYLYKSTDIPPHLFVAPEQAKEYAKDFLRDLKSPVVFSLRKARYDASRDSLDGLTEDLITEVTAAGHDAVVIPDQETELGAGFSHESARLVPEASHSLALRLALHEQASLTVIPSCGLLGILYLAKKLIPMIIYRPVTAGHAVSSKEALQKLGFNVGEKRGLPWGPDNQHWIWSEDPSLEDLRESLSELLPASSEA